MLADGHIHTPFCPHGSTDSFEEYIEWFIKNNVEEISFTEHAPLPKDFIDTTPTKDSGMTPTQLTEYIEQLQQLKQRYQKQIKINIGLEIDFIEGYESSIKKFLQEVGPFLDDSILSVHFIKDHSDYYCIDYSDDYFRQLIQLFGSASSIYKKYYETVRQSIVSELGPYKPKRIGHITLAHKFQLKYPPERSFKHEEEALLDLVRHHHLALDYNGAGTAKIYCGEPYPPEHLIQKALALGIPLVYGSDAHCVKDLGQGFSKLYEPSNLVKPSSL